MAGGKEFDEVYRHFEIADSKWRRWLVKYGGMKASDARRPKQPEAADAPKNTLIAESKVETTMPKKLFEGLF